MSAISSKHSIPFPENDRPAKRVCLDPDFETLSEEDEFESVFETGDYHFWGEEYQKSLEAFQRAAELAPDEEKKERALLRAGEVIRFLYPSSSGGLVVTLSKLEHSFKVLDQLSILSDPMGQLIRKEVLFPWFDKVLTFHEPKSEEELNDFLRRLKPLLPLHSAPMAQKMKEVPLYLKEKYERAELLSVAMTWVARVFRGTLDLVTLRASLQLLQIALEEIDWSVAEDIEKDAFFCYLFAKFLVFPSLTLTSCFSPLWGNVPLHAGFKHEMEGLSRLCDLFFRPESGSESVPLTGSLNDSINQDGARGAERPNAPQDGSNQ